MSEEFDPVGFAWKVHDALDAWTSKVDAKASIVLSLETAILGLIVALSGKEGVLADLDGGSVLLLRAGVAVLVAAIVLAGASVIPQLRRRSTAKEWEANSIYFGHLRHWTPTALADRLQDRQQATAVDELARQHVRMATIAWRKHSCLQVSMILVPTSALLILLSTL